MHPCAAAAALAQPARADFPCSLQSVPTGKDLPMYLENVALLKELNIVSIALRIFLALLLGGLLGLEREQKRRPAGFRTYIVVCVGASLASITNIYLFQNLGAGDPARIPAQVISGIGFLGAGTILVTRSSHIKGLTTAAGLWCSATIGIAVGCGFYSGAIVCSLVIAFSLRILTLVDRHFDRYRKYMGVYVEFSDPHFCNDLFRYCNEKGYELTDLEMFPSKYASSGAAAGIATFTIKTADSRLHPEVLLHLRQFEDVLTAQKMK